jgi:hypothetical protein
VKPLRISVPLGAAEAPSSFASRLAAANRLSAREFCLDFGLKFQSVVDGDVGATAKIAGLGGVDTAALAAYAFVRGEKHAYEHRGQQFVRSTLRRRRIHVCPACLLNDIRSQPKLDPNLACYNRAAWIIDVIKTCPTHSIGLTEITADETPGSLHDFAHLIVPALPHLARLAKEAPPQSPNALETYVMARLDGARRVPYLDSLELHVVILTSEMIGAVAQFGRTVSLTRLTDNDWWLAGGAGFDITSAGPTSICEFLTKLQRTYRYGHGGQVGPQALYGRFFTWLAFGVEHSAYNPIRSLVGRHIRDTLPLGPADGWFGVPITTRRLHSIRTLSVETGLHFKRLRKLLLAANIIDRDQMALMDKAIVFDAKRAAAMVAKAEGALALPAAGRYLNAPRVQIHLLAENNFIKPCVLAANFSANDRFAISELDEFLRRLLVDAHPVKRLMPGRASIPLTAKRACCSAADIVRLIIDKKLKWVGRHPGIEGYLSVLVDINEIRIKVRGADHGGLTPRQTASTLETTDKVVVALIATGDLPSSTVTNPINRCPQVVVSPEEVAGFKKKYISLFALAKERRKHIKTLKNELDAAGIKPAFDQEEIGATFYLRRDC